MLLITCTLPIFPSFSFKAIDGILPYLNFLPRFYEYFDVNKNETSFKFNNLDRMENFLNSLGIASLLLAFIGGSLIGLPTGPARFFIVDTSLNEGRKAALQVYGGLFSAVLVYAGLALLGDDFISRNRQIETISYFIASLLLIFWGCFIIKGRKDSKSSIKINVGSWFTKGLLTGLSNPVIPFIYLTFLQVLKLYTGNLPFSGKVLYILLFEFFSFLTTALVALILMKKRKKIQGGWKSVKILMGTLLIGLGAYNSYQQLDFSNGIKIKQNENLLEEEAKKLGR